MDRCPGRPSPFRRYLCLPGPRSLRTRNLHLQPLLSKGCFFKFFFLSPYEGKRAAIVPQLLPILCWLTLRYEKKINQPNIQSLKEEADLNRSYRDWSWFETKAPLFIVSFIIAILVCRALRTSSLRSKVGNAWKRKRVCSE